MAGSLKPMSSEKPLPENSPEHSLEHSPEHRETTERRETPEPLEGTGHREGTAPREVTVRRAPRFVPFMALGAVLGFIAALVVAYTGPVDPTLTRESVLGFFTVAFAIPGLILGAVVVLILDRRSVRRAQRAHARRSYDDDTQ